MKHTKALLSLMLMGSLLAQDLPTGKTQQPKAKTDFHLTYYDIRESIMGEVPSGQIVVEFEINEEGEVENPVIRDAFDVRLNDTIINKVMMIDFKPALQNGRPVRVRYKLPIVFK